MPKLSGSKRRWWWLWLQDQRRDRAPAGAAPSNSTLMTGLTHFYVPQVGATRLKSWNEAAALPNDPVTGFTASVWANPGAGYFNNQSVHYEVLPYGLGGGRIYSGLWYMFDVYAEGEGVALVWDAWSATPAWVTGFTVVRSVDGGAREYLDVPVAQMVAGWSDTGEVWTAGLPANYYSPPTTAKVLWNMAAWANPTAMQTVLSPLGGVAYDSTNGDRLLRAISDDLRRSLDGTFAYWVSPADNSSGVLAGVRGAGPGTFYAQFACGSGTFDVTECWISMAGHQSGDWYLVVHRNDAALGNFRIDVRRMRDGATGGGTVADELFYVPLDEYGDYFSDGWFALLAVGNSGHWGVAGPGHFDRIGIWNRRLTDDEVDDLFNSGLGWQPA